MAVDAPVNASSNGPLLSETTAEKQMNIVADMNLRVTQQSMVGSQFGH